MDISVGNNTYTALDKEGNVYTWNRETQPTKQNIENIIRISAGNGNVTAIESNGLLWTWGENSKGQLGLNSKTNLGYPVAVETEITETSSGGTHTIIQKIDKKLYGTGDMYQTSIFEEIVLPETITNLNPIKYFKTGHNTTTIMLKDGTIYGEGGNTNGELGIGTTENASQFTQGLTSNLSPLTSVLYIGRNIGGLNTTAILENGDIYGTGDNTNGQIGDGTTESKKYYTKMGNAELEYEEKEIIIDEAGYQIDTNKLKYNETALNVYDNHEPIELGKLEYTSSNTDIAEVDEKGFIRAKKGSGTSEITIRDIDNQKETKITVLVNRLLVDTDTVTYIYNIDDLVKFRDSVNAGDDYAGKTVYVMADIDMSTHCSQELGVSWTPIGATGTNFAGTFDGNYHRINKLYYNASASSYVGLFSQNDGIIQNVILTDVNINYNTPDIGYFYAGGIAGYNNGIIMNCGVNSGSIAVINTKIPSSISNIRQLMVGGITGENDSKILNCYNKSKVTCINFSKNTYGSCAAFAGGIAGHSWNPIIENTYNTGTISASATHAFSGGIIGENSGDAVERINNCYNTGVITTTGVASSQGAAFIGRNGYIAGHVAVAIRNSYYGASTATYAQYYWNGTIRNVTSTQGIVNPTENLKTYAKTLGTAYENDDFNINDGYPILWWEAPTIELNKKQAYIKTGENLQLEINSTVGARRTVPTTRECFNY